MPSYVRDKERDRTNAQRWRKDNPIKYATYRLRERIKKYGLTVEDFALMAVMQDFRCAICRQPPDPSKRHQRRLHVDHDHETGEVRGLLCMNCNVALGAAKHDPALLRGMADYLG